MKSARNSQFESALPRLLDAYDHGRLLPFLGAGASVPVCPLWQEFVENLERLARVRTGLLSRKYAPASQELLRRAADAVRRLKNDAKIPFAEVIRQALRPRQAGRQPPTGPVRPPVSEALARIWWPLVLTTNYDDWFYALWNSRHTAKESNKVLARMEVAGRGSRDCQRVLNSLRAPDNPLLWALHGFMPCQNEIKLTPTAVFVIGNPQELGEQAIVGHEEYRRQVHNSLVFRRAFSEVFRSRSLLFLGTSLSDPDFLDLFDEILELHGPNPHPHFALLKRGSADPPMLSERLQIRCIEYEDHDELPGLIHQLDENIQAERPRAAGWSFNMRLPIPDLPESQLLQPLHILRGSLPMLGDGECAALNEGLSAPDVRPGGFGQYYISNYLASHTINGAGAGDYSRIPSYSYIWRVSRTPIVLVTSLQESEPVEGRDARAVAIATEELMRFAFRSGYRVVHAMLQASGPNRPFPPHVSLIQMIKGFARWRQRVRSQKVPSLLIHVVHPVLLHLLESERLNVGELLTTRDTRFWLEIWRTADDVLRFSEVARPSRLLSGLLKRYDVPKSGWTISVHPSPTATSKGIPIEEVFTQSGKRRWTVASVGLLPGSTLRVARVENSRGR